MHMLSHLQVFDYESCLMSCHQHSLSHSHPSLPARTLLLLEGVSIVEELREVCEGLGKVSMLPAVG